MCFSGSSYNVSCDEQDTLYCSIITWMKKKVYIFVVDCETTKLDKELQANNVLCKNKCPEHAFLYKSIKVTFPIKRVLRLVLGNS